MYISIWIPDERNDRYQSSNITYNGKHVADDASFFENSYDLIENLSASDNETSLDSNDSDVGKAGE